MRVHSLALLCALTVAAAGAADQADDLFDQSRRWVEQGEMLRALDGFGGAWKLLEKSRGVHDPKTIEARIFYGQLLALTDRAQAALTVLGPISTGTERTALIARSAFALALRQDGQHKRSNQMLKEVIRSFPRKAPDDLLQIGRLYCELAASFGWLKKFAEGEAAALEGVRLIDEAGEPYRTYSTNALIVLGNNQILAGHDADAQITLAKALAAVQPTSRREVAILEGSLGMLALRAGRLDEAERRTRASMALLAELLGPEHAEVVGISRQLAIVLTRQKRNAEAKELESWSQGIANRRKAPPSVVSAWSSREVR